MTRPGSRSPVLNGGRIRLDGPADELLGLPEGAEGAGGRDPRFGGEAVAQEGFVLADMLQDGVAAGRLLGREIDHPARADLDGAGSAQHPSHDHRHRDIDHDADRVGGVRRHPEASGRRRGRLRLQRATRLAGPSLASTRPEIVGAVDA